MFSKPFTERSNEVEQLCIMKLQYRVYESAQVRRLGYVSPIKEVYSTCGCSGLQWSIQAAKQNEIALSSVLIRIRKRL